jgi:hypothetical protein
MLPSCLYSGYALDLKLPGRQAATHAAKASGSI